MVQRIPEFVRVQTQEKEADTAEQAGGVSSFTVVLQRAILQKEFLKRYMSCTSPGSLPPVTVLCKSQAVAENWFQQFLSLLRQGYYQDVDCGYINVLCTYSISFSEGLKVSVAWPSIELYTSPVVAVVKQPDDYYCMQHSIQNALERGLSVTVCFPGEILNVPYAKELGWCPVPQPIPSGLGQLLHSLHL